MQGRKQQSTARILFLLSLGKALADTNSTNTPIFSLAEPHYSDMTIGLLSMVGVLTIGICIFAVSYESIKKACCNKRSANAPSTDSLPPAPSTQPNTKVVLP